MFRITLFGLCAVVLSSSVGCMTAPRVVRQDADMVIIAVPDETNDFPTYYKDEAAQMASEIGGGNVQLAGSMKMPAGKSLASPDMVHRDGTQDQKKPPTSSNNSEGFEYHLIYKVLRPYGGSSTPGSTPNNVNIPSFDTSGRSAPPSGATMGNVDPVGWNDRPESKPSSRSAPPPPAVGSSTPRLDTPAPATNDAVPSWNAPRPLPGQPGGQP